MLVAQHLDFDVARLRDELLDEDAVIAEGGLRFRHGGGEAVGDFLFRPCDAHALAAAACRRLDHDRIADLVGDLDRFFRVLDDAEIARHGIHACGIGELLGLDLVAHHLDGLDVRTDEGNAVIFQRLREPGVLRQEAVAGMNGLGARLLAGGDDLVDDEIGFGSGRRADMDGFIRHLDMQRILVGIGIDGDGGDAHLLRRLHDAAGDFAPVCDQDFLEHVSAPQSGMLSCFFHGFSSSL